MDNYHIIIRRNYGLSVTINWDNNQFVLSNISGKLRTIKTNCNDINNTSTDYSGFKFNRYSITTLYPESFNQINEIKTYDELSFKMAKSDIINKLVPNVILGYMINSGFTTNIISYHNENLMDCHNEN